MKKSFGGKCKLGSLGLAFQIWSSGQKEKEASTSSFEIKIIPTDKTSGTIKPEYQSLIPLQQANALWY